MTKQEFMAKKDKLPKEALAGQLLVTQSKTSLKELHRGIKKLDKLLYEESTKKIPLNDALSAIETAMFYTE